MSTQTGFEVARPTLPDARGKFGSYGGRFVPETLMPVLDDVTEAYEELRDDPASAPNTSTCSGPMSAGPRR